MRRLLDRLALLVIGVLVVAALAWEAHVDRAEANDNELRVAIDALRADAGSVDELALSAIAGRAARYDPLVDHLALLADDLARVESIAHKDETLKDANARAREDAKLRDADVIGAIDAFRALLHDRKAQIEEVKGLRGALTNSEREFPKQLPGWERDAPEEAAKLESSLVAFLLETKTEHRAAVEKTTLPEPLAGHLRVILDGRERLDTLSSKLIDPDLSRGATEVARASLVSLGAAQVTAMRVRAALLVAIAFVALLGLWLPRRM